MFKKNAPTDKHAAKKAVVLRTEKKSCLLLASVIAALALLIAGGILFISRKGEKTLQVADSLSPDFSATTVTYPVEIFEDGQARHFQYRAGDGIAIKYFILKSSDGLIRAAFDACDVCWRAGKGYYQAGDFMVCRNCGRRFASFLVNEVQGGCNPAPLNRKIVDGKVVIRVEDIREGKQYFEFSRRS
ncbi:MAG TPA: DUF2318 domain-containing protein [Proteobacteria bacterium]|nr:DUF2318 domain-containing protein [Pseudomonadota bacterium]